MGHLRIFVAICAALAFWSGSALAAVDIVLSEAKGGPHEPGTLRVSAFFMNQGDEPASLDAPQTISCRLEFNGTSSGETMEALGSDAQVPSSLSQGAFYRRDYTVRVPEGAGGVVRIIPQDLDASGILLAVAPAGDQGREMDQVRQSSVPGNQEPEPDTPDTPDTADSKSTAKEDTPLSYVISNLSTYKPMYFVYGANPAEAKFQLSFKYRLFNPKGDWAGELPWLSGFHIAYTQTSWWDMDAISKPFKDSSYMPEFFWQTDDLGFSLPYWIEGVGVRTGVQHESNGKAGDDSRSLNIAYVEPLLHFPLPWDYDLTVAPKVWTYIMDLSDNADIADYRGYFDLRLTLGQDDGPQLTTNLRKGTDEGKGSIQLDLTYPLARITNDNLGLYLQAQFFDGYAESLIDYEEAHTSFYLGVAVSRW